MVFWSVFLSCPVCIVYYTNKFTLIMGLGWAFTWNPRKSRFERTWTRACLLKTYYWVWVEEEGVWRQVRKTINHGWRLNSYWTVNPSGYNNYIIVKATAITKWGDLWDGLQWCKLPQLLPYVCTIARRMLVDNESLWSSRQANFRLASVFVRVPESLISKGFFFIYESSWVFV